MATKPKPHLKARSALANAVRNRRPADEIDDLRRRLHEASLAEHIRKAVDAWPPLTAEQRTRLALLLKPKASA